MVFNSLGNYINYLRKQKQWSLRELSEKAGISPSFLMRIEKNDNNPSFDTMMKILHILGADMGQVFSLVLHGTPITTEPSSLSNKEFDMFLKQHNLTLQDIKTIVLATKDFKGKIEDLTTKKKIIIFDEAHLLAPEKTKESVEIQKKIFESGVPFGYKSTIVKQSFKDNE